MYTCANWQLEQQFPVATADLEDIAWSPDGACLAAWDTCLTYKLSVFTPDGQMLTAYSAYQNALGIKAIEWSPSGQLLAVGSFDQVPLLAHLAFFQIAIIGAKKRSYICSIVNVAPNDFSLCPTRVDDLVSPHTCNAMQHWKHRAMLSEF